MSQSNEIEEFIYGLEFRRRMFGGCDEDDVLVKVHELGRLCIKQSRKMQEDVAKMKLRIRRLEKLLRAEKDETEKVKKELAVRKTQLKKYAVQENAYFDQILQLNDFLSTAEMSELPIPEE